MQRTIQIIAKTTMENKLEQDRNCLSGFILNDNMIQQILLIFKNINTFPI